MTITVLGVNDDRTGRQAEPDEEQEYAPTDLRISFARTAPNEGNRCRVCGCTETNACMTPTGPCHWIEPGLCSSHGRAA